MSLSRSRNMSMR